MEKLIAVHRHITSKGHTVYGWAWIKKESEAYTKCLANLRLLDSASTITEVWVCNWKDEPSKYKLVYGDDTALNQRPNWDQAANLRKSHLKQKGETKRQYKARLQSMKKEKPRVSISTSVPTPAQSEEQPFRYFTPEKA